MCLSSHLSFHTSTLDCDAAGMSFCDPRLTGDFTSPSFRSCFSARDEKVMDTVLDLHFEDVDILLEQQISGPTTHSHSTI